MRSDGRKLYEIRTESVTVHKYLNEEEIERLYSQFHGSVSIREVLEDTFEPTFDYDRLAEEIHAHAKSDRT